MDIRSPRLRRGFHPVDPPHGTRGYDVTALTEDRRRNLNERKAIDRRENEIYLSRHPEVRGLISILVRYLLQAQPSFRIHEAAGEFFNRPRRQIAVDLLAYFSDADCPPELKDPLVKKLVGVVHRTSFEDTESGESVYLKFRTGVVQ